VLWLPVDERERFKHVRLYLQDNAGERQKQALGEFVQRRDEELRELAIPRQTLRGACQRYER
jgi:hypothetical protein